MYQNLEIDHIFTIVNPSFKSGLQEQIQGLIGHRKEHQGQGTTAEFILFQRNYLEFIWL